MDVDLNFDHMSLTRDSSSASLHDFADGGALVEDEITSTSVHGQGSDATPYEYPPILLPSHRRALITMDKRYLGATLRLHYPCGQHLDLSLVKIGEFSNLYLDRRAGYALQIFREATLARYVDEMRAALTRMYVLCEDGAETQNP